MQPSSVQAWVLTRLGFGGTMKWPELSQVFASVEIPVGLVPSQLTREEVPQIIESLSRWFPDISVSSESYHLDPDFYFDKTLLAASHESESTNVYPLVLKHLGKPVFFVTLQRELNARTLTGRLLAIDPNYRGQGLANLGPRILETMGKSMGVALLYYYASVTTIHQQMAAERAGFKLIGLMPASDRHLMAPGRVCRIFEAIYAKVLVSEDEVFVPPSEALTPQTQALWNFLFHGE